jgi:drug/metabolite transporter (DMT)-like permease
LEPKIILLVEDNPDDEALTLRTFKQNNLANEVVVARDGVEALDYLFATGVHADRDASSMPTLILLDLKLPAVSTGAIFARMADAPALVIAAYRVGLAALILAPFAWWKASGELCRLTRREYWLAGLAGLFLGLHFATWISSLMYTSVATSVVLGNTSPLWVGLLTPWLSHDRLGWQTRFGIAISITGGAIIGAGDFALERQALWGDVLALLASVCTALYLLLGRTLRDKLSLLAYVVVCYSSATLMLLVLVLALHLPIIGFSGQTYALLLAMAVVPQVIGHSSYNWALKWFSTSVVAVSLLGVTVGSTILAYLVLGEGLTWTKVLGGTLILAALYLVGRGDRAPLFQGHHFTRTGLRRRSRT